MQASGAAKARLIRKPVFTQKTASIAAIPTAGASRSTVAALSAAKMHWDKMRSSSAELSSAYPKASSGLTVVTSMNTYARCAHYLFEYKKASNGDTLDACSIINYMSALMIDAMNRFLHEADATGATVKSFECLTVNSTSDIARKWNASKGCPPPPPPPSPLLLESRVRRASRSTLQGTFVDL
jgi:hypothetical protein